MANPWIAEIARINNLIQTTQRNIARDQALISANPNSPDAGRWQQQIASGENYIVDLRAQLAQFTDEYNQYEGRTVLARPVVDPTVETGTNAPVRTIEQTQATSAQDGVNVGIPLPDETGAIGSIRRNPETGELYDAGGLQAPTDRGVGAGTGNSADATRGNDNNPPVPANSAQQTINQTFATQAIISQPNVLDQYSSYTYAISWWLLTPEQYNASQLAPAPNTGNWSLLCQSGGAPVGQRNPSFPVDFYLDDLEIETYLMGKGTNMSTNAADIRFKVVEPNGLTLIQRLYEAVVNAYKFPKATAGANPTVNTNVSQVTPNYGSAIYALTIEFYGYDSQGNLVAPARGQYTINGQLGNNNSQAVIRKYYPFLIQNITFRTVTNQIEYQVTGKPIPYATGTSQARGTIPFAFALAGTTVSQLLQGSPVPINVNNDQDQGTRRSSPAPNINQVVSDSVIVDQSRAQTDANGNFTGDTTSPFNVVAP